MPWVLHQMLARLIAQVTTRQRHHALHAGVSDQIKVKVDLFRDRDLDHHLMVTGQRIQPTVQFIMQQGFRTGLVRAPDQDFGFQDGHKASPCARHQPRRLNK
ncbi:hypothetical protein MSKU3_0333 [Komagataeibacter oboediens]|nr:hypothetical protein MSKU3_0333 [Komagataeibacter oboediens]